MAKDKLIIHSRSYKAEFCGEYSSMDYHIVASGKIIQEVDETLRKIESKYKKRWNRTHS